MAAIVGRKALTEAERDELIAQTVELSGRYPQRVIARKLGISQASVVRYLARARENGLAEPNERYLSEERRAQLVEELSRPGWNLIAVARKYGITKGAVYYHARRHGFVTPGEQRLPLAHDCACCRTGDYRPPAAPPGIGPVCLLV
jgi:transposase-like protein